MTTHPATRPLRDTRPPEQADVELVVLDMAGTTVRDDGLVERAFAIAADRSGFAPSGAARDRAIQFVRDTMGQSKIEVFLALTGDADWAAEANAEFEAAYAALAAEVGVTEIPGAADTVRTLRRAGVSVALTTGFAPATRDALIAALGWSDLADVVLAPADVGRGRPHPDLPLTALLRTGAGSVGAMAVVGDTQSDIRSGRNAGAGLVVGVLTGAHDRESLENAGADRVIDSIVDLPALLGLGDELARS